VDVHIDELQTSVDVVDGNSLLTPGTLAEIVRAVIRTLENERRERDQLRTDLDTSSVVERQRAVARRYSEGGGW
jgi:hypothetical protein